MLKKMMIIFVALLVSRAFAIDATESEQFSFGGGLALGINTPLSPSSSDVNFKHGAGPSFCAGLGIEYYFSECFAVQLKAAYQYAGLSTSRDDGTEITTDAITLDSPLLLKYTSRGRKDGQLSVFAGTTFSFTAFDGDDEDEERTDDSETKIHAGDFRAIGFETGIEYAPFGQKGFRFGLCALFDFVHFQDSTHVRTRRACFMPSVSYWL